MEKEAHYQACRSLGLNYGSSFQTVQWIATGEHQALVKAVVSETTPDRSREFVLHPGLVDAALQAALVLANGSDHGGERP